LRSSGATSPLILMRSFSCCVFLKLTSTLLRALFIIIIIMYLSLTCCVFLKLTSTLLRAVLQVRCSEVSVTGLGIRVGVYLGFRIWGIWGGFLFKLEYSHFLRPDAIARPATPAWCCRHYFRLCRLHNLV
jgi:hypothetical protein